MDYSQTDYFAGTKGPHHQFPITIPSLTFSNTYSAGSEDFDTTSSSVSLQQISFLVSFVLVHDSTL